MVVGKSLYNKVTLKQSSQGREEDYQGKSFPSYRGKKSETLHRRTGRRVSEMNRARQETGDRWRGREELMSEDWWEAS